MEQSILDVHCDCEFAIIHTIYTKARGVVIDAVFYALAPPTRRDLAKPKRDSFSRGSVLTIRSSFLRGFARHFKVVYVSFEYLVVLQFFVLPLHAGLSAQTKSYSSPTETKDISYKWDIGWDIGDRLFLSFGGGAFTLIFCLLHIINGRLR